MDPRGERRTSVSYSPEYRRARWLGEQITGRISDYEKNVAAYETQAGQYEKDVAAYETQVGQYESKVSGYQSKYSKYIKTKAGKSYFVPVRQNIAQRGVQKIFKQYQGEGAELTQQQQILTQQQQSLQTKQKQLEQQRQDISSQAASIQGQIKQYNILAPQATRTIVGGSGSGGDKWGTKYFTGSKGELIGYEFGDSQTGQSVLATPREKVEFAAQGHLTRLTFSEASIKGVGEGISTLRGEVKQGVYFGEPVSKRVEETSFTKLRNIAPATTELALIGSPTYAAILAAKYTKPKIEKWEETRIAPYTSGFMPEERAEKIAGYSTAFLFLTSPGTYGFPSKIKKASYVIGKDLIKSEVKSWFEKPVSTAVQWSPVVVPAAIKGYKFVADVKKVDVVFSTGAVVKAKKPIVDIVAETGELIGSVPGTGTQYSLKASGKIYESRPFSWLVGKRSRITETAFNIEAPISAVQRGKMIYSKASPYYTISFPEANLMFKGEYATITTPSKFVKDSYISKTLGTVEVRGKQVPFVSKDLSTTSAKMELTTEYGETFRLTDIKSIGVGSELKMGSGIRYPKVSTTGKTNVKGGVITYIEEVPKPKSRVITKDEVIKTPDGSLILKPTTKTIIEQAPKLKTQKPIFTPSTGSTIAKETYKVAFAPSAPSIEKGITMPYKLNAYFNPPKERIKEKQIIGLGAKFGYGLKQPTKLKIKQAPKARTRIKAGVGQISPVKISQKGSTRQKIRQAVSPAFKFAYAQRSRQVSKQQQKQKMLQKQKVAIVPIPPTPTGFKMFPILPKGIPTHKGKFRRPFVMFKSGRRYAYQPSIIGITLRPIRGKPMKAFSGLEVRRLYKR